MIALICFEIASMPLLVTINHRNLPFFFFEFWIVILRGWASYFICRICWKYPLDLWGDIQFSWTWQPCHRCTLLWCSLIYPRTTCSITFDTHKILCRYGSHTTYILSFRKTTPKWFRHELFVWSNNPLVKISQMIIFCKTFLLFKHVFVKKNYTKRQDFCRAVT